MQIYYSLSVISQNTTILESFSDVYPNAELIDSDEVRSMYFVHNSNTV